MDKISKVSRIARLFFKTIFYLLPISIVLFWVTDGHPIAIFNFNLLPEGLPAIKTLSTSAKWLGFIITLIPTAIGMVILHYLAKLFKCYQQGQIFEVANARCFRYVGLAIIVWEIIQPVYDILISWVFTHTITNLQVYVRFDVTNIRGIIIAIIMLVIAWVMEEGTKLAQEQEYTI